MSTLQPQFFHRVSAPALAYHSYWSENSPYPTVLFLGGFRSDMQGSKALYFEQACRQRQQPFVRFDYRGHGQSAGVFTEGTIGLWLADALAVFDQLTVGPVLLVGSSMGGWIGLLLARARAERVCGFVGIAAAPDFTREIWEERMSASDKETLMQQGFIDVPNHYSLEPYTITERLLADGAEHYILENAPLIQGPVHLVQGMKDEDVLWQTAPRLKDALSRAGNHTVTVHLIEDGNHRLSRPEDLVLIDRLIESYRT